MRQLVQNRGCSDYRAVARAYTLPDGRRLEIALDRRARVVDSAGDEMAPSPSELAALIAVTQMGFLKRGVDGKRRFRLGHEDDLSIAV